MDYMKWHTAMDPSIQKRHFWRKDIPVILIVPGQGPIKVAVCAWDISKLR